MTKTGKDGWYNVTSTFTFNNFSYDMIPSRCNSDSWVLAVVKCFSDDAAFVMAAKCWLLASSDGNDWNPFENNSYQLLQNEAVFLIIYVIVSDL